MRIVNICAIVATLLLGLIAYDVHQFTRPARPLSVAEEIAAIKASHARTLEILKATQQDDGAEFRAMVGTPTKTPIRGK